MGKNVSCSSGFSKFESSRKKSKGGVVILLALSLAIVRPPFVSGQINQQQEQQQREEQQRQEQAGEQQQRDQEERDRQAREEQQRQEQQREEQQRQEQAREQQQRDQAERDRQAREEQQREEQQREEQQRQEQAREQEQREAQERQEQAREQQRDRRAREEQQRQQQQRDELQRQEERQRQTPVTPMHGSPPSNPVVNSQVIGATPSLGNVDLHRKPCDKEACAQPKPVLPNPVVKLCTGGPCPVCGPGRSPGKENSCVPATQAKAANAASKPNVLPQSCLAGQVWNGVQCAPIAAQQCLPGQTTVGSSCQTDCTLATTGAQSYIELLRMARQDKDSACLKDPTGDECRSADLTYQMRLNEYRTFLGGVSTQCTLPDPISI